MGSGGRGKLARRPLTCANITDLGGLSGRQAMAKGNDHKGKLWKELR